MIEFLGHFHPVLVHLPIGFLLIGLLLQWLSHKKKYASIKPAIAIIFLWGTITAIVTSITGYLLSISDDYDKYLVNWHMWIAISVVIISAVLYTKEVNPKVKVNKKILSIVLLFLIMFTGHLGGSLTHGSDYLTKPFSALFNNDSVSDLTIKPLANVQEALVYNDVVQPIFQTKCYSCHNANKQKGGLRMDDISLLMKGGKNGEVINLVDTDSSEIMRRLLLPVDNEDHMPPKEKPQPSESEVALLHWWIRNNADFKKKVKELDQPANIKPILLALQKPADVKKEQLDVPSVVVEKADEKVIEQLKQRGANVLPVARNSNYLAVNFINDTVIDRQDLQLLEQLKKQVISLKADNKKIAADAAPILSTLSNLRRLNLANTNITDKTLEHIQSLDKLQYLNLVGTAVSSQGIMRLKKIKALKSLYLYQTTVTRADFKSLAIAFPETLIDTGNYIVPFFATDTTAVKAEKKY
jgi:uncharacterized membrane protein/flagellar biosynthesis/type III secretory pathway chaperone